MSIVIADPAFAPSSKLSKVNHETRVFSVMSGPVYSPDVHAHPEAVVPEPLTLSEPSTISASPSSTRSGKLPFDLLILLHHQMSSDLLIDHGMVEEVGLQVVRITEGF